MDAQEIIVRLHDRAEDFCRYLFPNGKRSGAYWAVGNLQGDPGDSLRINVEGDKVGVWADHARGDDATGATLVHLWMEKSHTTNWGKAIVAVKEWLGIPITGDEDRVFRQQARNGGKFETAALSMVKINPDGPVFRYLTEERKISPSILEAYRVAEHKDKAEMCFAQLVQSGKAVAFAKYVAVQRKPDGSKSQWSDPKGAVPGLWGKHAISDECDEIVITEGEIDALSVAETGFAAVSMPNGAGNDRWIERDWRWLEGFRSIILCFDPDEAGQEGLAKVYPKLIGRLGRHRCRIARMPDGVKDPNDALQQGKLDALVAALNAAESIDPEPLKPASHYEDRAADLLFPPDGKPVGIALPWTDKLRLRPGEVTLWTGINSHGKSTALLHCLAHLTQAHDERAIVASMEAPPHKSMLILCRQVLGREITTREQFQRVYARAAEKVWFYDCIGTAPWRELIDTFRYAWRRYGVSQFVVDSLMATDVKTDDYNEQSSFICGLADFANESQGHVHVVAHARKGKSEDDPPGKMDVAGHANLTNRTFNGLTIFRNKAKDEEIRDAAEANDKRRISEAHLIHDAELVCWKQRETGEEFIRRLWFHRASLQFWPEPSPGARPYIPSLTPSQPTE